MNAEIAAVLAHIPKDRIALVVDVDKPAPDRNLLRLGSDRSVGLEVRYA